MRLQGDKLDTTRDVQTIGADHDCVDAILDQRRISRIDLAIITCMENVNLRADRRSSRANLGDVALGDERVGGIDEQGKALRSREKFVQKTEMLSTQKSVRSADPSGVAPRPVNAGHQPRLHRIASNAEDDWNCRGRGLGCKRGWRANRGRYDCDAAANEIGRQFRQSVDVVVSPPVLDDEVAPPRYTRLRSSPCGGPQPDLRRPQPKRR